eukprot:264925_1
MGSVCCNASNTEQNNETEADHMLPKEYKIVLLGGGGCGKTDMLIRVVCNKYIDVNNNDEYDASIEDSYRHSIIVDRKPVLLDILETAGGSEFSSMQDQWIREGKGFILFYSITCRHLLDECIILREKILRAKDEMEHVPIVLVGTNNDLEDQRQISFQEGKALAKEWAVPFYECSARDNINVKEPFFDIVREMRKSKP